MDSYLVIKGYRTNERIKKKNIYYFNKKILEFAYFIAVMTINNNDLMFYLFKVLKIKKLFN